jgi:hypothetical protein
MVAQEQTANNEYHQQFGLINAQIAEVHFGEGTLPV